MSSYATYAAGTVALHPLINQMIASAHTTKQKENIVINEIPDGFIIGMEKRDTCQVMEELLHAVMYNARNGDIHISAEKFADTVVLQIQDRNNYNGYALSARLQGIEPAARKLGGDVFIKGQQQLVTTISFYFPAA